MNKYTIEIFWSDDDNGYIAIAHDLPSCNAFGETQEEALHEIRDAITAWLEACQASGEPIPEPSRLDVFDYKDRVYQQRLQILDELAAQAQELNMGYE